MFIRASTNKVKGLPTKHSSKQVYPKRTCLECGNYPCFEGIDNCNTDFAKAGCIDWKINNNNPN